MGVEEIVDNLSAPKEANRQIGPLFKTWINSGALGCIVTDDVDRFNSTDENMIYNASDGKMKEFAQTYLGYTRNKGLDFICRFNKKYIIGEAKFLTDFGGHQNAQLEDALFTLACQLNKTSNSVQIIAILDGVLYINKINKTHKTANKMRSKLLEYCDKHIILSSVLLRDFIYSL